MKGSAVRVRASALSLRFDLAVELPVKRRDLFELQAGAREVPVDGSLVEAAALRRERADVPAARRQPLDAARHPEPPGSSSPAAPGRCTTRTFASLARPSTRESRPAPAPPSR